MKKENGWFIDDNNNKWDADFETSESAEIKSKSLVNCSDCSNCSNCRYCSNCSNCSDCRYCSDLQKNPQRITSGILGSRDAQTTIYWTEEKEIITCGCFKGTIAEFKKQVAKTHGSNNYTIQYFDWIKKVEIYKNANS